jgi:4-amino-4-deoxy-L-arabinose transferase-like glycosyltransferase
LGETETVLRTLPALFAAATVPVAYLLGSRLLGTAQGLVAAALLATNAFFISHAQEVRSYSLSALLATVSTLFFVQVVDGRSRAGWGGYVAATALGMYAHFFTALVVVAHVVSLVFLPCRDIPFRALATAYSAVGVLVAPLAYFAAFNDVGQVDWIPKPDVNRLAQGVRDLTGGGDALTYVYEVLFVLALGLLARHLRLRGRSQEAWSVALVLLWVVLPVGIAFGASYVKPLFVSRYLLVRSQHSASWRPVHYLCQLPTGSWPSGTPRLSL